MRYLPEETLSSVVPSSVWSDESCRSSAVQDLNECLSELDIKGGVYDGIYGAVHVAQPSESVIHLGGDLAFCAVGVQDVRNEKWQPAYDEDTWGCTRKTLNCKRETVEEKYLLHQDKGNTVRRSWTNRGIKGISFCCITACLVCKLCFRSYQNIWDENNNAFTGRQLGAWAKEEEFF